MKDVTDKVSWGNIDDEILTPFTCICGHPMGHIDVYKDKPVSCPKCGKRFFFEMKITVWEVNQ